MSVPKSLRKEGELQVLTKSKELTKYTIRICSNEKSFPKKYRWCVTNKIVDDAVDISRYITMANSVFPKTDKDKELRRQYQNQAIAKSYALLSEIDVAYTTFGIESDRVAYWTKLVLEVQSLLRAWRTSEEK